MNGMDNMDITPLSREPKAETPKKEEKKSSGQGFGRKIKKEEDMQETSKHMKSAAFQDTDMKTKERAKRKWKEASVKASKIGKGSAEAERRGVAAKQLEETYWKEAVIEGHVTGRDSEFQDLFNEWKVNHQHEKKFEEWIKETKGESWLRFKIGKIADGKGPVNVQYHSEEFRKNLEVSFKDGQLYQDNRLLQPLIQENPFGEMTSSGKLIFVISPANKFYIGRSIEGLVHHSSFLAGASVCASGSIKISASGKVREITEESGHYRQGTTSLIYTLKFLEEQGVDINNIKIKPREIHEFDPNLSLSQFLNNFNVIKGSSSAEVLGLLNFIKNKGFDLSNLLVSDNPNKAPCSVQEYLANLKILNNITDKAETSKVLNFLNSLGFPFQQITTIVTPKNVSTVELLKSMKRIQPGFDISSIEIKTIGSDPI